MGSAATVFFRVDAHWAHVAGCLGGGWLVCVVHAGCGCVASKSGCPVRIGVRVGCVLVRCWVSGAALCVFPCGLCAAGGLVGLLVVCGCGV